MSFIPPRLIHARKFFFACFITAISLALFTPLTNTQAAELQDIERAEQEALAAAARSQARIDALDDETETLLRTHRSQSRRLADLTAYNDNLEALITTQGEEAQSLRQQIDGVVHIDRALLPLMDKMLHALEQFVALDIPFLQAQRLARLADLRASFARADITVAEKYRKLLEAYEIENEYGRTIESYEGNLDIEGEPRAVHFLRIGRIALIYQTSDESATGIYDAQSKTFVAWDEELGALKQAFRIARNQAAPDFLIVPLSVSESVRAHKQEEEK